MGNEVFDNIGELYTVEGVVGLVTHGSGAGDKPLRYGIQLIMEELLVVATP